MGWSGVEGARSAPRFNGDFATRACRAAIGRHRWNIQCRQRNARHTNIGLAAGPVNNRSSRDDCNASIRKRIDRFPRRTAGSDHIFNHEHVLVFFDRKSAPQRHAPLLSFSPNESYAEMPRHFITDDQATDGRCSDGFNRLPAKFVSDGRSKSARDFRRLQSNGALQINGAVQPAGQNEVPFEQSTRLFEDFQYVFLFHN